MDDLLIKDVESLLGVGNGHEIDHVIRVRDMALRFAEQEVGIDLQVVKLSSLLHDIDDYKLVGKEQAAKLYNARELLRKYEIESDLAEKVLDIIGSMGYSNHLRGVRPETIEGKIVSDADMCDSIGAEGILRAYDYQKSIGNLFFDPNLSPSTEELSAEGYQASREYHSVQVFFDRLFLIPSLMMTDGGREEAAQRQDIMVSFLRNLFREHGAEEWGRHLDDFLRQGPINES